MIKNIETYRKLESFVRGIYQSDGFIPLHAPHFKGNEKQYLLDCIDSTFVSSVGKYVDEVEKKFAEILNVPYAVAVVNGTSALHLSLMAAGVTKNTEVITQPLTFVATCNAISYIGAFPLFVDVSMSSLGLSAELLENFLANNTIVKSGICINKNTGRQIVACCPMHTFGHPAEIFEIKELCDRYNLKLVEDAAEALGSRSQDKAIGTFGDLAAFSFNGNKIITSGGGGMIVTHDRQIAKWLKHMSTVAKVNHRWNFVHDAIGYNYRMPNINAALLLAQLEKIDHYLQNKQELASRYKAFFSSIQELDFFTGLVDSKPNNWLNVILTKNSSEKESFLEYFNNLGIMCRPAWTLIPKLKIYNNLEVHSIGNSEELFNRVVNIPSSVVL